MSTGDKNYTYQEMLDSIIDTIKARRGDDAAASETFKLLEPRCNKTPTKAIWHNFTEQSEALNRDPPHILAYFLSEMGCTGVIGSNGEMILTGNYMAKHFFKLIKKYSEHYVRCNDCRGYTTELTHVGKERLDYLNCKSCGASRTVETIGSRFVATKRGERRKNR